MSNFMVGFLFAVGVGTWVYTKAIRSTGGNKQSALIAAGFCGFLVFLVVWMSLNHFSN